MNKENNKKINDLKRIIKIEEGANGKFRREEKTSKKAAIAITLGVITNIILLVALVDQGFKSFLMSIFGCY